MSGMSEADPDQGGSGAKSPRDESRDSVSNEARIDPVSRVVLLS